MITHPYILDALARGRQADLLAEAANHAAVAEALRSRHPGRSKRPIRIVRTPTWSSRQPIAATRTDMAA